MVTFNLQPSQIQPLPKSDPLSQTSLRENGVTQEPNILLNSNNNISSTNLNHSNNTSNNNIAAFYDGEVIFMTGATGFLGKALLEKLLRSCNGVKTIYVLIRPKRGQGIEQRLKELIKSPVFDRVRDKTPEYFDKIIAVPGDVSHPNLGLSDSDKHILISSVTIAFHSAATVRFNETLKDAVLLNTGGTKRIMKLCKEMRYLKSFVHVSTAYSNADKREIEEIVYPPPYDPETILKCVETLPLEALNVISEKIQGKHPNTYTLTKAMAEHIVSENSSDFPIAIVRPSIVTAAWKEPYPGWVDNVSGISGIMMEVGRGTIRSIVCEERHTIDVVPVDVVASTLVTAAWHVATHRSNSVRVYNCTSGQVNPVRWGEFGGLTVRAARLYPSRHAAWPPGLTFRTNRLIHAAAHAMLHVLPACVLDVLLVCMRRKPIMLRICNKFAQATHHGTFFALNEWKFNTSMLRELVRAVRTAEDGATFQCDMSTENTDFDWDNYVQNYMQGIRKYVLKDDESTLEAARTKIKRLHWANKIFQLISLYFFIKYFISS